MDGTAKELDVAGMRGDLSATHSFRLDKPESHRSKVSTDVGSGSAAIRPT